MTVSFRRLAGYAISAATVALLALTPAMPVDALDRAADTIRVTENQVVEKGKRYLPGTWPKEDVIARRKPDDPCNTIELTT